MRRHAFDPTSFIAGAVFVTIGVVFALAGDPWRLLAVGIDWRWLAPVVLIGIGAAILLPVVRRKPAAASHPGAPPADEPGLNDPGLDDPGLDDPGLDDAHRELPPAP